MGNDQTATPMAFNNGLSIQHDDKIDDLRIAIHRIVAEIDALGRHRNYSLAVTKLEEAELWLANRKHKPA